MTFSRQRMVPVLALLLAVGAANPATAQQWATPIAAELAKELKPDDPRWVKADTPPSKDHPLVKAVSGQIFIVRPSEPGPNKKAELAFGAMPTDDGVVTVHRRTLGTMNVIYGKARLVAHKASNSYYMRNKKVWLLEVKYDAQDKRGAEGALAKKVTAAVKQYSGLYAIRAKGNVLLGHTTAPKVEGKFEEKALAQGVRYRRAGSLMEDLSKADPEEKARMEALQKEKTEDHCWVTEFSASAEENTSIRRENLGGVAYYFNPPEEIVAALAVDKPKHVFVMAHGWQNDRGHSLEFAGGLVKGLRARMKADGVPKEQVEFVFVSWNSKRINFMESALCAETIGHRGLAPMLHDFRKRLPKASLTLVGHSLGGRMMLATLQGPDPKQGSVGRWKQARARNWALSGRDALDGAFARLVHRALRGRYGQAPKVDAVVLLEAAIDVQSLHDDIGLLNYGDTPCADKNAKLIANAHSKNDEILRVAYTASNGVMNIASTIVRFLDGSSGVQALGRLGAQRSEKENYASIVVPKGAERIDMKALNGALSKKTARPTDAPTNRVVNVDVTALLPKKGDPKPDGGTWEGVESHTEINQPAIFDLIWQATKLTAKVPSAK